MKKISLITISSLIWLSFLTGCEDHKTAKNAEPKSPVHQELPEETNSTQLKIASEEGSDDSSLTEVEAKIPPQTENTSLQQVEKNVEKNFPIAKVKEVKASGLPGIYMVAFESGEVLYSNGDATKLLRGELFVVEGPGKIVNRTEEYVSSQRVDLIANSNTDEMIIFPADKESKADVYVFTDVDCGYCRKFHQEIPRLNNLGITVNYLAWPRAGTDSETGKVMRAVWCSKDQNEAMTMAKFRKGKLDTPSDNCKDPIEGQLELGRQLGVRGTPAIFLKDGRQVGGFRPAADLAKEIGIL